MPKQPNESYLDYKKRVIDSKSATFCAAKWLNATIWLGSGTTASCHHPPAHRIEKDELLQNPSALHNTRHKKLMRKQMLQGERPKECEYCWKIEDIKRDNVSDRVFKTMIYSDSAIQNLTDWQTDVPLKTLEIAFDRTCNFACSYCNASFSTKWARDIKDNGPYQNLVSDGARAFQQDGAWAQPYRDNSENPYITAFWAWWPELSKSLQELRITGGEPLMSPEVWKLFEFFKENGSGQMLFALNSNLGSSPELIDKFAAYTHFVQKLDVYTSCESFGQHAEYIRDGLNWELWQSNIHRLLKNGNIREFHMMMTINSLCLFSITEFLDFMLELKTVYGKHRPSLSVNILRFPSFMSPLTLPAHLRQERREELDRWLSKNANHPLISEMEHAGLKRLSDYLEVVETPHSHVSGRDSQWRDFKSFYEQYDKRRSKDFRATFPKSLVDWFDTLPATEIQAYQQLVDGDASNVWKDDPELKELAEKEGWCLQPQDSNPGSADYAEAPAHSK